MGWCRMSELVTSEKGKELQIKIWKEIMEVLGREEGLEEEGIWVNLELGGEGGSMNHNMHFSLPAPSAGRIKIYITISLSILSNHNYYPLYLNQPWQKIYNTPTPLSSSQLFHSHCLPRTRANSAGKRNMYVKCRFLLVSPDPSQ